MIHVHVHPNKNEEIKGTASGGKELGTIPKNAKLIERKGSSYLNRVKLLQELNICGWDSKKVKKKNNRKETSDINFETQHTKITPRPIMNIPVDNIGIDQIKTMRNAMNLYQKRAVFIRPTSADRNKFDISSIFKKGKPNNLITYCKMNFKSLKIRTEDSLDPTRNQSIDKLSVKSMQRTMKAMNTMDSPNLKSNTSPSRSIKEAIKMKVYPLEFGDLLKSGLEKYIMAKSNSQPPPSDFVIKSTEVGGTKKNIMNGKICYLNDSKLNEITSWTRMKPTGLTQSPSLGTEQKKMARKVWVSDRNARLIKNELFARGNSNKKMKDEEIKIKPNPEGNFQISHSVKEAEKAKAQESTAQPKIKLKKHSQPELKTLEVRINSPEKTPQKQTIPSISIRPLPSNEYDTFEAWKKMRTEDSGRDVACETEDDGFDVQYFEEYVGTSGRK